MKYTVYSMKYGNRGKGKPGYTLVEFLLASGIMVILLTVIVRMFVSVIEMRLISEAESALSQDIRYLYLRVTDDLVGAEQIVVPGLPGESGTSLEWVEGGVTYGYEVIEEKLYFSEGGSLTQLSSAGVAVVGVEYVRREEGESVSVSVRMDLESEVETVSGRKTRELSTTVRIR